MAALLNLAPRAPAATFGEDAAFLQEHTDVIVLQKGDARLALAPAWQGRVMTSGAAGDAGFSYGWINRGLIASGRTLPHMNPFGGEDRFWMGPEGGQFGLFFRKGAKFQFSDWFTPAIFDTLPFRTIGRSGDEATFGATFTLTNYAGTSFQVEVRRRVRLLGAAEIWKDLGLAPIPGLSLVAYETDNRITNVGPEAWKKETGLVSIWILGMYNPSPSTVIVAPIRPGPDSELGTKVTSDYFGPIPADRLAVRDDAVFLKADGKYRSKIGLSPRRSRAVLGSYDGEHQVLTVVQFSRPAGAADYVNSLWKVQDDPYGGDAANAYNDGPPAPGEKPMGPFCEVESSSPAAALAPGRSLSHLRRTVHFSGPRASLDAAARATLGVSLEEIETAFGRP